MRKRALAFTVLLACCVAAFWAFTAIAAKALTDEYAGVGVRIADTAIPGRKLKRLLDAEPDGAISLAAAWTRGEKTTAASADMETTTKLRTVCVTGDMRQVAPMTLLSGSYLTEDDPTGCLLDEKSAQLLFHSVEATGASVTIDTKRYTVRGVVTYGEPAALIRGVDAAYENLEFAVSDLPAGRAEAEAFLYKYALSSDYVIVQNGLYARIALGLAFLPVSLMLLLATLRLLRAAVHPGKRTFAAVAAPLFAALFCAAAMALLLRATFFWPQAYLPTKCADFAFWRTLLAGWREAWNDMALMMPLPKDVMFFSAMRVCVCRVAAILLLEVLLYGRLCRAGCERPLLQRDAECTAAARRILRGERAVLQADKLEGDG